MGKRWTAVTPIFVDARAVEAFVRRQRKINALARAWVQLPQVVDSTVPIGVAKALIEASDENLTRLTQALE